jgi:hypothetical protein
MKPFANESDVTSIGGLEIENRTDRISIGGALDITRDKAGLKHAQALKQFVNDVIAVLESADLPDAIAIKATGKKKNPFA